MQELMHPELIVLLFLSAAALTDFFTHRIPNILILAFLFPGGFLLGPHFLMRLLATAVLFYPLTRLRLMGAGDVKLLALVSAYLGRDRFLFFLLLAFLTASFPSAFLLLRGERGAKLPLGPFFLIGYALSGALISAG